MSHQIMTPERIAEINRIACNLDRENPAYGALNEALDALEAAQQEIAARDAEIAKMQEQFREFAERSESDAMELRKEIADLKRGGVDAAELDAISDAIRSIGNDAHDASTGPAVPDALWDIRRRAYDVCARIDGIRAIPADRVLGEGMVAVDREELDALRHLLDCARAAAHEIRAIPADRVLGEVIRRIAETKLEEDDDEYEMSWDASYSKLSEIVNDCRYALRAQATQEPTP